MASALPGGVNTAVIKACILRAVRLGPDCTPLTGADMGIVTDGLASVTASPDVEEGTAIEPVNGCGQPAFVFRDADQIKRWTGSGELMYFDPEALELMIGGELLVGLAGESFAGESKGWATPHYQNPPYDGIYLEIISKVVARDAGDCVGGTSGVPVAVGRIFGKAKLTIGDVNQQNDHVPFPYTFTAEINPNLGQGPWGDAGVVGGLASSPSQYVYYDQTQFDAINAMVAAGYQTV